MRYVSSRLENEARERAYRFYVTDALKIMGHLDRRYADIYKPVEKRTAEEIKKGIIAKLAEMSGEDV